MFQPPCAGGSFLARRDTTEPQSIDWTSTLMPASRTTAKCGNQAQRLFLISRYWPAAES